MKATDKARIELDASSWVLVLEFYEALLDVLDATAWHGRNLNALLDTMIWSDDINGLKQPHEIVIKNLGGATQEVREEADLVVRVFAETRREYDVTAALEKGRPCEANLTVDEETRGRLRG